MTPPLPPPPDVPITYTYADDPDDAQTRPTPRVRRVCPHCASVDWLEVADDTAPPASHADVWRVTQAQPVVRCKGTTTPPSSDHRRAKAAGGRAWWWCRESGMLLLMSEDGAEGMRVTFFKNRRARELPVAVDRRGR